MTFSGSTITQWSDKSGNGYHATIASGRIGATYSSALNAVNFATSSTGYVTSYPANPTNETMFVVFNNPTPSSGNNILIGGQVGARSLGAGYAGSGDNTAVAYLNNEVAWLTKTPSGSYIAGSTVIVTGQVSGSTNFSIALNGATFSTGTGSAFSSGTTTYLGVDTSTTAYYYVGHVMEILFYNSVLTTAQRQQVEGYLAHKWGLVAPSPTTPLSIPGCQLWLDAADATSITGTTTVTQWRDKSGNARHLGAGSGTTSYSSNAIQVNNSYLYVESPVDLSKVTVFIVVKTAGGGNQTVFSGRPQSTVDWSSVDGFGFFMDNQTAVRVYGQYDGVSTFSVNTSTPQVFSFQSSGTSLSAWYNGISQPGATFSSTRTSTAQGFAIGASWSGSLYYNIVANASVYEAITYNTILTTTQRQTVEGYLAKKWSIGSTSMIPSTHPFSKVPPHLRLFKPNDVTGCQLWLDAADSSTITGTTSVTAWRDKSGSGNNAVFTGTNPSYTPANNYVETSNLNQAFSVPSSIFNTVGGSLFIVYADKQENTQNGMLYAISSGYTPHLFDQCLFRSDGYSYALGGVDVPSNTFKAALNTKNTVLYNINYVHNTVNYTVTINGTVFPFTSSGVVVPSGSLVFSGGWGGGANVKFNEILFYNSILTTSQRQQIEWYLANKWGLFSTSPVSTPLTIPGCGIWLDGADTSSLTFSGSAITQWRDKSGSSNHFGLSRGTATSILDGGRRVVNFGEATVMVSTNQITFTTSSAFFIVSKMTSTNGAQNLIGFYPGIANGYSLRFFSSVLYSGNGDDLSLGNYYVNGTFNPSFPSTTYYNTYSLISTLVPSRGGTSIISLSDNWILDGHAQRFFIGNIAEFLFYPGGVTNLQRQKIEGYLANKWGLTLPAPTIHPYDKFPPASEDTTTISARGGTITTSGSYKIHTFTTVGTTTFTLTSSGSITAQVLVLGGGGGGGSWQGGGGGAGGAVFNGSFTITSGTYNVIVGDGGAGDASTGSGYSTGGFIGGNSSFNGLVGQGGGGGGTYVGPSAGTSGGCGGGSAYISAGAAGTQGFAGGSSLGEAGGGGGMGSVGQNGGPGTGGNGFTYTLANTAYLVAGGGGAGQNSAGGTGGGGGGGNDGNPKNGYPGTTNKGGGGGGGGRGGYGGKGGSGIVIIAYTV
jgi:predicted DNA-binding protein YlxM (UPF0122 family)